jgi:hypothetical protein
MFSRSLNHAERIDRKHPRLPTRAAIIPKLTGFLNA